jgi:hypothetical protein
VIESSIESSADDDYFEYLSDDFDRSRNVGSDRSRADEFVMKML